MFVAYYYYLFVTSDWALFSSINISDAFFRPPIFSNTMVKEFPLNVMLMTNPLHAPRQRWKQIKEGSFIA